MKNIKEQKVETPSVSQHSTKLLVSCVCPFCGKAHKKVVSLNETCLDCSEYFNGHRS
jgi:hypothetical protein